MVLDRAIAMVLAAVVEGLAVAELPGMFCGGYTWLRGWKVCWLSSLKSTRMSLLSSPVLGDCCLGRTESSCKSWFRDLWRLCCSFAALRGSKESIITYLSSLRSEVLRGSVMVS